MARAKTRLLPSFLVVLTLVASSLAQNLTPVADPNKRVEFHGFSVLPPSGKNWFVVDPPTLPKGYTSAETVQFTKVPGKMHSVYVMAMLVNPAAPQTLEDLRFQVLEDSKGEPRFKPVKTEAYLAKCFGYDCVRFDLLFQDHAPADFPGTVLMLSRRGFIVPHPYASGFEVWVESSERFKPLTSRYPLDAELEPFLKSLQFTPIRLTSTFPDDCKLPRGETEAFSYGCQQGAYRMRLKKPGPVHVTGTLGLSAQALSLEVDSAVTSGSGTEPGKAMLGIGCLTGPDRGYVALVKTNGGWGIASLEKEFIFLAGSNRSGEVSLSGPRAHLGISCVRESSKKASLITFFVNGQRVGSAEDRRDSGPFDRFALYADTFPGLVVFERLTVSVPPK